VTANCFHPGLVATGFNRNNGPLMDLGMTILRPASRSPEKGAKTLVWLATSPDVANASGAYFFDQQQRPPSPEALSFWSHHRTSLVIVAMFISPVIYFFIDWNLIADRSVSTS
jgi:hypothetical protein